MIPLEDSEDYCITVRMDTYSLPVFVELWKGGSGGGSKDGDRVPQLRPETNDNVLFRKARAATV